MKVRLAPLYLVSEDDPAFVDHLAKLQQVLADWAELLTPRPLGAQLPDADAVVLPQLVGAAYGRVADFRALKVPVLVLTSDFGTMAMWDWEIISYLRSRGISLIAPYSAADAAAICRALGAKRELHGAKFVVYQDAPGEGGKQAEIFKRFYWWEEECADRIHERFGVRVLKKSFRELGARAKALPDDPARRDWAHLRHEVLMNGLAERQILSALKLYQAVRSDLDAEGDVVAAGINCLNESAFSDTTPCLAWDLLYTERDLIWGCEADLLSMLTKFIMHKSLRAPVVMTNLYPFLMGQAALQHERIPAFPVVDEPANYVLGAHCGYLGVLPRPMAAQWALRPKALAIVDDDASAIDARLPVGDLMLSKLGPDLETLYLVAGELRGYAQWAGSDCLNGAVIRVPDGPLLMERLPSHHSVLVAGNHLTAARLVAEVFGLTAEVLGAR